MNLRILKKLSKRAAPYLPLLGDRREQFKAERWNSYMGVRIWDRKHWDRSGCHPTYDGLSPAAVAAGEEIIFNTRAGRRVVMRPPSHPRKGTMMVGGMSGYYEPEWDEECAWAALVDLVYWAVAEIDSQGEIMGVNMPMDTPRQVFAAADAIAKSAPASMRDD